MTQCLVQRRRGRRIRWEMFCNHPSQSAAGWDWCSPCLSKDVLGNHFSTAGPAAVLGSWNSSYFPFLPGVPQDFLSIRFLQNPQYHTSTSTGVCISHGLRLGHENKLFFTGFLWKLWGDSGDIQLQGVMELSREF